MIRSDVIVVGAGASGLAAARDLARSGLSVAVVEARERAGGRIATVRDPSWPVPVELGPEFIHGHPDATFALVEPARLLAVRLEDVHWELDRRSKKWARPDDFWDVTDSVTRRMRKTGRDRSVAEFLAAEKSLSRRQRDLFLSLVEGYHAAIPSVIGEHSLSTRGEKPRRSEQFRVVDGYDRVTAALAEEAGSRAAIFLRTIVRTVRWDRRSVEVDAVTAGTASTFAADRAIVTIPASVWRAPAGAEGAIRFEPELPAKRRAVEKIETGPVVKVVFRFREKFWESPTRSSRATRVSRPTLGFAHAFGAAFPTWWSADPLEVPVLTAWAGGPDAAALAALSEEAIAGRALATLSELFRIPERRLWSGLEAWRMHDWQSDPFARGAYSYLGVGGVPARTAFARPVARVLFFAGEATDSDQSGTVAGAIASGRRAARQLLSFLRTRKET